MPIIDSQVHAYEATKRFRRSSRRIAWKPNGVRMSLSECTLIACSMIPRRQVSIFEHDDTSPRPFALKIGEE